MNTQSAIADRGAGEVEPVLTRSASGHGNA
jgi:hypothetical protein